ncbi:hypothetical protein CPB84DRAFT_1690532 [Gymnopilus junonius]|uniref:Uncharacterized protein n=1 Tax=Gymnopilus junonius TaxID=109634 RepID=A0A9P5TGZ6_GYMJU|nr:hypothetical protein CPB84DRAFT_1690532 [Gymnopilus junonius]
MAGKLRSAQIKYLVCLEPFVRTPHILSDSENRIGVILVGRPDSEDWDEVVQGATEAMEAVRRIGAQHKAFKKKDVDHRRGKFTAFAAGVSFGGPGNLVHTAFQCRLVSLLLHNKYIWCITGFQSSSLAFFAPKLYCYYANTLTSLFDHHPGLEHNFSNSIFPACTFNCGPATVALDHLDDRNLSHGLCGLTALGSYDLTRGGHLILLNMKLYVRFPPGSTALIPSACLHHANTKIWDGETRLSFAQYTASGLFRWVAYGFQSAKNLEMQPGRKVKKTEIDEEDGTRWEHGLAMFSKIETLAADQRDVFDLD